MKGKNHCPNQTLDAKWKTPLSPAISTENF